MNIATRIQEPEISAVQKLITEAGYIAAYLRAAAKPGALPVYPEELERLATQLSCAREAAASQLESAQ